MIFQIFILIVSLLTLVGLVVLGYSHFLSPLTKETTELAIVAAVFGTAALIYFYPANTAVGRQHPQASAILALNLLLGWTFIGWVLALVWALAHPKAAKPLA